MKGKTILRLTTDGLMTGAVLLSIANKLTENTAHEIIGVLMILLFSLHQVLNWRWYSALFKGRYDTRRIINTVVNGLLLAAFGVLIGGSVMISRTLFSFLGIDGSLTLRQIHTTTAYWFLIFTAVHIGIHWPRLVRMAATMIPMFQEFRLPGYLKRLIALMIIAAGIHACFDRNLGAKLFMTYAFDFWDFDQSVFGFFARNLAIIDLYAVLTHSALAFLKYRKGGSLF